MLVLILYLSYKQSVVNMSHQTGEIRYSSINYCLICAGADSCRTGRQKLMICSLQIYTENIQFIGFLIRWFRRFYTKLWLLWEAKWSNVCSRSNRFSVEYCIVKPNFELTSLSMMVQNSWPYLIKVPDTNSPDTERFKVRGPSSLRSLPLRLTWHRNFVNHL